MTLILKDYFSRWWWFLLNLAAIYAFQIGGFRCVFLSQENPLYKLSTMGTALELGFFFYIQYASERRLRFYMTLPLSAKEVGRAWWWGMVGLPGLALVGLTSLVFVIVPPRGGDPAPISSSLISSVPLVLLSGVVFTGFFGVPRFVNRKATSCWIDWVSRLAWMGLWSVPLFYEKWFPVWSGPWCIFVILGALTTLAGWLNVETFVRWRAGFGERNVHRGDGQSSNGYPTSGWGGLAFLAESLFKPMLLSIGLAMPVMLLVIHGLTGSRLQVSRSTDRFVDGLPVIAVASLLPAVFVTIKLPNLRFIRTLPISALKLVSIFVVVPTTVVLLSCSALSAVAAMLPGRGFELFASLTSNPVFWIIATSAIFVAIFFSNPPRFAMGFVIYAGTVGSELLRAGYQGRITPVQGAIVALLSVTGSVAASRIILERSSRAYRYDAPS